MSSLCGSLKAEIPPSDEIEDLAGELVPDYATRPGPPGASEVKYRGGVTTHFPVLVHAMLSLAEVDGYDAVCGWCSHGRSFSVYDRNLFVGKVLPLYFRQTQFPSFQRQLNLYGFRRCQQSCPEAVGSYFHPMFLRTRQDLCPGILRQTEKEICEMKRRAKSPSVRSPDFGGMKPMPRVERKQIEMARSISIPQRKNSAKVGASFHMILSSCPHGEDTETHSSRAPLPNCSPPRRLPEDDAVKSTYTSLFLNNNAEENQLDLSWLEPTPIAPKMDPGTQNNPNNTSQVGNCSSFEEEILRGGAFPERNAADQGSLTGNSIPSWEKANLQVGKVKRERSSESYGGQSSSDGPMAHFLEDIDLTFSDSEDYRPPPKALNAAQGKFPSTYLVSMHAEPGQCDTARESRVMITQSIYPLQRRTHPQQQESWGKTKTSSSCFSVSLPRNCAQLSRALPNEAFVITSSGFPYSVIYANTCLERTLARTKAEILDKTLASFCVDKAEYARMNAACFDALLFRDSIQEKQDHQLVLTLGDGRIAPFQTWVGPFFTDDDLVQTLNPLHLVWRFREI